MRHKDRIDTLAFIDEHFPDNLEIDPATGRSHRWQRHLIFAGYGLGERGSDLAAFHIANANEDSPLPLDTMRHIAANWQRTATGEPA